MKTMKYFFTLSLVIMSASVAWAVKGVVSTDEDIARLKQDLINGQVEVSITRLNDFRDRYGEAANITESEKDVTYDYGDLKIKFDIDRYWKEWSYDTFKETVYTDDAEKLRKDLEGLELAGDNITYAKVVKDYGVPTATEGTNSDGMTSVYYYGNIKLVFENVITVSNWKGKNLDTGDSEEVLGTKVSSPAANPAVPAKPVAAEPAKDVPNVPETKKVE